MRKKERKGVNEIASGEKMRKKQKLSNEKENELQIDRYIDR